MGLKEKRIEVDCDSILKERDININLNFSTINKEQSN